LTLHQALQLRHATAGGATKEYPVNIFSDSEGIELALQWAAKAMFITTPNPRVGCVIVKDTEVIGAGHTLPAGQAHAEVQALRDAAERGMDVRGATVYVTLEPCSHFGRTPPCANALVQAGVARVVVAVSDPNPLVTERGLHILRAAGIEVVCGVHEPAAVDMNIGFMTRMRRGTPWVRMKTAASLDAKTALRDGRSQWITSPAARDDGHWWRARACAVLTGIGTVQQDNPQLNVRAVQTARQPIRIVIDSRLQIDPAARILEGGKTWIATACRDAEKEAALCARGADILMLPSESGRVDLAELMRELGRREINELHVEAGPRLNGALIRAACVDELLLYLAPSLLGDAQDLFDLPAPADLASRRQLSFHEIKQIGPDLRILARFL
jgi:diaminohydroxyphosphoribosylaminopyrimidine deaminase / 5-amino-6-(5-phosphoribosylamino)uracil reductase